MSQNLWKLIEAMVCVLKNFSLQARMGLNFAVKAFTQSHPFIMTQNYHGTNRSLGTIFNVMTSLLPLLPGPTYLIRVLDSTGLLRLPLS